MQPVAALRFADFDAPISQPRSPREPPSYSDLHVGARHRRRCIDLVLRCEFDGAWHRVSAFSERVRTARPPIPPPCFG